MATNSSIQSFFIRTRREDGTEHKKCRLCNRSYILNTGGNNLKYHVEKHHSSEYAKFAEKSNRGSAHADSFDDAASVISSSSSYLSNASSSPSPSSFTQYKQSTLTPSLLQYQNSDCLESIAKCFAMASLPLRLIETPEFIDMMSSYRKSTVALPGRKQLSSLQRTLASKLTDSIVTNLSIGELPVALAIDGWVNVRHSDVTNVIIISNGKSFLYKSIENHSETTNAHWMYETIKPILQTLFEKNVRVVGVVMDNAAKNNRLYALLHEAYPHFIRLPCAAHVLQLCVKRILSLECIGEVIERVDHILNLFRENSALRLTLKNIQVAGNGPVDDSEDESLVDLVDGHPAKLKSQIYTLIRPIDTR
jgi:Protein of unknown function (DUF 659)